jgi:hypothetical protein
MRVIAVISTWPWKLPSEAKLNLQQRHIRRHCKKSRKGLGVIPAQAGHVGQWREIHSFQQVKKAWIPFLRGYRLFAEPSHILG